MSCSRDPLSSRRLYDEFVDVMWMPSWVYNVLNLSAIHWKFLFVPIDLRACVGFLNGNTRGHNSKDQRSRQCAVPTPVQRTSASQDTCTPPPRNFWLRWACVSSAVHSWRQSGPNDGCSHRIKIYCYYVIVLFTRSGCWLDFKWYENSFHHVFSMFLSPRPFQLVVCTVWHR